MEFIVDQAMGVAGSESCFTDTFNNAAADSHIESLGTGYVMAILLERSLYGGFSPTANDMICTFFGV